MSDTLPWTENGRYKLQNAFRLNNADCALYGAFIGVYDSNIVFEYF